MLIALGVADLIMLGTFLLKFSRLPPQIPLFYSRPWGESQLADLWVLSLIPFLLHLFFFFNLYYMRRIFPGDRIIFNITKVLNWALIMICTGTFLRILFVVS